VSSRVVAAALAALLLAACGGSGGDQPTGLARLWITKDRGAQIMLTTTVPAGQTVLRALDEHADVKTRYGGRFVQAIDGIEGSLSGQRDWFYFVNGIEPDVGAAQVTLHPGDVAWWDYRSWADGGERAPAVVGAFPEPFRHGWEAKHRPVVVEAPSSLRAEAEAIRTLLIRPGGTGEPNRFVLAVRPGVTGALLTATRGDADDSAVTFTLSGSLGAVRRAAERLVADPSVVARRYEARFDERGRVRR
jgi:hypothetical protein